METTTTWTVNRLGVKFAGRCVVCESQTGDRSFELADTLLLRAGSRWGVAHPRCAGVRTKGCVGGGRAIVAGPSTLQGNGPAPVGWDSAAARAVRAEEDV